MIRDVILERIYVWFLHFLPHTWQVSVLFERFIFFTDQLDDGPAFLFIIGSRDQGFQTQTWREVKINELAFLGVNFTHDWSDCCLHPRISRNPRTLIFTKAYFLSNMVLPWIWFSFGQIRETETDSFLVL